MPALVRQIVFLAACAFSLTPWCGVPMALAIGMALGLSGLWAFAKESKAASKYLIQCAIVLLGFWISLDKAAAAGVTGIAFSTAIVLLALGVSEALHRLIHGDRETSTLISAGTAICGGSAIAATGAAINAKPGNMAVATGIVFILNAAGVYAYPAIGRMLDMTEHQFGAWAAVGVHDVAGVLAASAKYMGNDIAQQDATIIKLTRVLWIAPVALALAWHTRRVNAAAPSDSSAKQKTPPLIPWYVPMFVVAVLLRAALESWLKVPNIASVADTLKQIATAGMALALLMIGSALRWETLKSVGWRAAVHGVTLWLIVSAVSLACVKLMIRANASP